MCLLVIFPDLGGDVSGDVYRARYPRVLLIIGQGISVA